MLPDCFSWGNINCREKTNRNITLVQGQHLFYSQWLYNTNFLQCETAVS